MIALALKYWWAFVIGGLLIALAASETRRHNANERFADYRAQTEANIRKASEAARVEESRLRESFEIEAATARKERDELQTEYARLADAGDGLRSDLAAWQRRARANTCAANGGKNQPGTDPIGMLANLLSRTDEAAAIYARVADERRVIAAACERSSDKVTTRPTAAQ